MRPQASPYRLGLNSCRYSSVHGRPRLPRSRRTFSTVSAFCITHTSLFLKRPSPGPLCPAGGVTALPGRSLLLVGWAARRGPVFMLDEPGPFPGSLPPNRTCPLSGHPALRRFMPRAENAQYHFGFLHCASLMVSAVHRLCPFALWSGFPGLQIGRTLPRRLHTGTPSP